MIRLVSNKFIRFKVSLLLDFLESKTSALPALSFDRLKSPIKSVDIESIDKLNQSPFFCVSLLVAFRYRPDCTEGFFFKKKVDINNLPTKGRVPIRSVPPVG